MAQRQLWKVEVGGGIDTQYVVLGLNPLGAAQRAWKLDETHQSHAERVSLLVQVAGAFNDVQDDIPQSSEDQLRADVLALTTRVASLESRVSSASTR